MTTSLAPWEQRWAADQADLARAVRTLQAQMAALTTGVTVVASTDLPANPYAGMPIYVWDTGLNAFWNGTSWEYPPQLLARQAPSSGVITFNVPASANLGTLRVAWFGRSDAAQTATYMCVRFNGDSGNNYLWQINQANNASLAGAGNSGATTSLIKIGTLAAATATSGYAGSGEFTIANASTSTFKAPSGYSNSANSTTNMYSGSYGGLWLSNAQITSITLLPEVGNLIPASTAALYGSS